MGILTEVEFQTCTVQFSARWTSRVTWVKWFSLMKRKFSAKVETRGRLLTSFGPVKLNITKTTYWCCAFIFLRNPVDSLWDTKLTWLVLFRGKTLKDKWLIFWNVIVFLSLFSRFSFLCGCYMSICGCFMSIRRCFMPLCGEHGVIWGSSWHFLAQWASSLHCSVLVLEPDWFVTQCWQNCDILFPKIFEGFFFFLVGGITAHLFLSKVLTAFIPVSPYIGQCLYSI